MRVCKRCNKEKKDVEFRTISTIKNVGICKSCDKEYHKKYFLENKEKIREKRLKKDKEISLDPKKADKRRAKWRDSARAWRSAHPVEMVEYRKTYYQRNASAFESSRRKWQDANREYTRQYQINYRNGSIVAQPRITGKMKPLEERRLALANYSKKYNIANKHKITAQQQARRAVADGTLRREPCVACLVQDGIVTTKVDGHHQDYDYPLNVIWLCRRHHAQVHQGGTLAQ